MLLLNEHHVKYLIVGGYAYGIYAEPRFTQDIDIFIEISEENSNKMIKVLDEYGFSSLGLTALDFQKKNEVIQLGFPPSRIDILMSISGVEFESAWENRTYSFYFDVKCPFIGIEELKRNKKASARDKDLKDLNSLLKVKPKK